VKIITINGVKMNKAREEVIKKLKTEREKLITKLKEGVKGIDPEITSLPRAGTVKRTTEKYYNFTKKIHHLESDYKDDKGSFLPAVYLTHYEFYIAQNKRLVQLEEDVRGADLNIEDPASLELKQYWINKKRIAERHINFKRFDIP